MDFIPKSQNPVIPNLQDILKDRKQKACPPVTRKCRVKAITSSVLIYVDIDQITNFFRLTELENLKKKGFLYDEDLAISEVRKLVRG